jgi:hypothetical protein
MQLRLRSSLLGLGLDSTQSKIKLCLLLAASVIGGFGLAHWRGQTYAGSLTSVSVTSTNVRPSFRGALTTGNVVGTNTVIINTTANAYASTSSAQLVEDDVLLIGSGGTLRSYTVASTTSLSTFTLTASLLSGDADSGDDVATASSNLAVRLPLSQPLIMVN